MGQVLQAGAGQITARQAAVKGGIPMSTPAVTINKVCLSGLNAIYLADQMIANGEADIVVAGGMESMTNAPYLLPGARSGYRIGDQTWSDAMMFDGLFCAFDVCAMGAGTEKYTASADGITAGPPGRLRRHLARAGVGRHEGGPLRRRDRPRVDPAAQGRPDRRRDRRGRAARHHAREPRARCGAPSPPTAPSPPATPARSATAAPPIVVMSGPRPRSSG
jgi:acetyl-CoA C-acetyltransferase